MEIDGDKLFLEAILQEQILNSESYDPSVAESLIFNDYTMFIEEFDHAVSIGKKYTNILLQAEPITANPLVGGYELPVVALVSPWCISACDNQAFLLKASERVHLLGTPANGTGAGFQGNQFHGPSYVDSLSIVRVRIPNYLFGLPIVSSERVIVDEDGSLLLRNNSENKPTLPHEVFNYTRGSFKEKGADWIKKAIEVIDIK